MSEATLLAALKILLQKLFYQSHFVPRWVVYRSGRLETHKRVTWLLKEPFETQTIYIPIYEKAAVMCLRGKPKSPCKTLSKLISICKACCKVLYIHCCAFSNKFCVKWLPVVAPQTIMQICIWISSLDGRPLADNLILESILP